MTFGKAWLKQRAFCYIPEVALCTNPGIDPYTKRMR